MPRTRRPRPATATTPAVAATLALLSAVLSVLIVAPSPAAARQQKRGSTPANTHRTTPAKRHHAKPKPAAKPVAKKSVKVWVNTKTGVYHYPGARWYGNTKEGEYMDEDAARKAGNRSALNGQ